MIKKLLERDWLVFALAFTWKTGLLLFTAQPIPTGDQYFYDGAVVHALNGGNYANPSLGVVLPIAGKEVFSAYPPLHQALLWVWMQLWGTGALSSMWFQTVVLAIYGMGAIAICRALRVPALWVNIGCLFLFGITFLDRPDTLAFAFGTWSVFAWIRAGEKGWSSFVGNGWTWVASGLVALTTCTSLHIGALFYLWAGLLALAFSWSRAHFDTAIIDGARPDSETATVGAHKCLNGGAGRSHVAVPEAGHAPVVASRCGRWRRRIRFPLAPLGISIVLLASLVALVKLRYPNLWAGFQEHVRETPTLAGWDVADPAGQLKGNFLRLLRTAPGLLAVGALCMIFVVSQRARAIASGRTERGIVVWSGLLVTGAIFAASFGLLMQGPVGWCAYLQPLLVAVFPVAITAPALSERRHRLYAGLCVALALVAAARAIGMGTWGVACARDVSENTAARVVRETYERAAPGGVVIASSAFLYEGDRHPSLRVLHADWIASHRHKTDMAECIVALRPATMILTQFDYYRGCGTELVALKGRPEIAELRIRNTASVTPPDAVAALSRVVQHVSWAPVIVELKWR